MSHSSPLPPTSSQALVALKFDSKGPVSESLVSWQGSTELTTWQLSAYLSPWTSSLPPSKPTYQLATLSYEKDIHELDL